MKNNKSFEIGTRVTYSRKFIQTNFIIDYDTANRKGTVVSETIDYGNNIKVQKVRWDDDQEEPKSCRIENLVAVTDLHKELY
jgi:hypothetical protein